MRTSQLNAYPNLKLKDWEEFDEKWQWIGSYATWRAAMFVYMYPENILLPSLRKHQTPAFRRLVSELRDNKRLTPEQARLAAKTYSEYFNDICQLVLEASCQTDTLTTKGKRNLFYTIARGGATNTVYWSAYDPSDASGYAQTFWDAVPGLKNVINLIGAIPYEYTIGLSEKQRFIFLFARILEKGEEKLVFTKYDLQKQSWGSEPSELELPKEGNAKSIAFTAVIKQTDTETNPPHLAIRLPSGTVFARQLNRDGTDWASGDWKPLIGRSKGHEFSEICGMIGIPRNLGYFSMHQHSSDADQFCTINRSWDGTLWYRFFGDADDGAWRMLDKGYFRGLVQWPETGKVYVLTTDYNDTDQYIVLTTQNRTQSGQKHLGNFQELEKWLNSFTGVSLKSVTVPGANARLYDILTEDTTWYTLTFTVLKQVWAVRWLVEQINKQREDYNDKDFGEWRLVDDLIKQLRTDSSLEAVFQHIFIEKDQDSTAHLIFNFIGLRDDSGEKLGPKLLNSLSMPPVPSTSSMPRPERIVPNCGGTWGSNPQFAYQSKDSTVLRAAFGQDGITTTRIAPKAKPLEITEQLSGNNLNNHRQAYKDNLTDPLSNLEYIKEASYFVPIQIALQLQQRGQYVAALDWFRTVYDYSVPCDQAKIYYGLEEEAKLSDVYNRAQNWLLDPLNPHLIAESRRNAYTRFTLLSLIRCFLEYADAEFTRDTSESIERARRLYMTALDLLEGDCLKQLPVCSLSTALEELGTALEESFKKLPLEASSQIWIGWAPVWYETKRELATITDRKILEKVVDNLKPVLAEGPWHARFAKARQIISDAKSNLPPSLTITQVICERDRFLEDAHAVLVTDPVISKAAMRVGVMAGKNLLEAVASTTGIDKTMLEIEKVELPALRNPGVRSVSRGGLR